MYRWQDVPWTNIQRNVFKLQKRIYQASRCGNTQKMRKLQKLLMKSEGAAFLAVRKVTQENRGKRTAGVDGKKELKPDERLKLAPKLQENPYPEKTCPVRRIWIPKPGTKKQRPLGIPTIEDRAHQALAKLALEPEWEAKFEPSSFGFRPGRSTHDAIPIIPTHHRINHDALLEKLHTFPRMRRTIKLWLKAGVMDGGTLFPTEEGTPQGSIVSPLLANVALHGLEKAITQAFQKTKLLPATEKTKNKNEVVWTPKIVRYADGTPIQTSN
jgi:RNA-directed DNA polymerase